MLSKICILVWLFFMVFPSVVWAGCSRPMVVAISPLSVYMEVDLNERIKGIIPDLLHELSKKTGCQFVYEVMPRVRALKMFESGQIDLIAASRTVKRDAVGDYVFVMAEQPILITLKESVSKDMAMDALMQGKLRVNVVRGFDLGPAYLELLAELRKKNQLEDVIDTDTIANKMLEKRCDATVISATNFLIMSLAQLIALAGKA